MPIFRNFFFLGNIGQENLFYDIVERKNAFPAKKNQEVQKVENAKNGHFWTQILG